MTVSLVTKGMIVPKVPTANFQGEIDIEPNRWQMIAIPTKYGYFDTTIGEVVRSNTIATIYNYVALQLQTVYGSNIENLIEVINAYIGDNNFFYNYIPGFTPENSQHNFQLVYDDDGILEITPFWIKSKVPYNMIIKWKSAM